MRIWLALLAAPSLALACQSFLLALSTPSCAAQTRLVLHGIALGSLVLSLLFTALAFHEWRRRDSPVVQLPDADFADRASARTFLAISATAVGGLSSFAIVAMWVAVWVLSPCAS